MSKKEIIDKVKKKVLTDILVDDFYTMAPKYRTKKKLKELIINLINNLQNEK